MPGLTSSTEATRPDQHLGNCPTALVRADSDLAPCFPRLLILLLEQA